MASLRTKLIIVVLLIALCGLTAVIISSLAIVRQSERESVERANRQVSDLISRSIQSQILEYRNKLQYIFNSWLTNPNVSVEPELFPDYLWIAFLDSSGKTVFEWSQKERLEEAGLGVENLLGRKDENDLFEELKVKFREKDQWVVFNSTLKTLYPTFLLGANFSKKGDADSFYVGLAEIHADKLYSSVQSRAGQQVTLLDPHQNILLSTKPGWDPSDLVFLDETAQKIITGLKPGESRFDTLSYSNREPQVSSFYKFKDGGGLTLGIQENLSAIREQEKRIQWRSLLISFFVLNLTVTLVIIFASSITQPLVQLMKMMEKVGKGEFTGKIKVKGKDEIAKLATMFNKMLGELRHRDDEIEGAKSRLIQSEKMSAFGQMSAGIAHEVKNPLAGILGYAQMTKKKLPQDSEVLPYIDIIEKETVRCKEIVENLMKFARQEKAVMARIDVNKTIKDSIRLVEHQISISGIKLVQIFALDGAPIWIRGNSNQIQQVMMNLMLNAQQAMENKGTLTVSTHYDSENQKVLVIISDTGVGMSEEVKARIFEPFYTTKGVGKGTGLGLSVSLGIIKDHGGAIEVDSAPGKGTTFTITLPCEKQDSTTTSSPSETPTPKKEVA